MLAAKGIQARRRLARIEKGNVSTETINQAEGGQFGKMTTMRTNLRTTISLMVLALLGPAFTLGATETATVADLAGQWQGKSRFTGISYEEARQKKVAPQDVETELHISAEGKVTGRIGGAALTNGIVVVNRGWLGRRLHLWTDFVIRGQIGGAVAPGSESGIHPISAPFNFDGTRMSGSIFVIHPVKYPYPFLSLRLSRKP